MIHDIKTYRESHGGKFQVSSYSMASGATFLPGEPVVFDGAGFIVEASADPSAILGIATESTIDIEGRIRPDGTGISVIEVQASQLWLCNQFATDGAATPATPTQANSIGRTGGLTLNVTQWTVDIGAGNAILRIEDVMDRNGISITNPNFVRGTGYHVIFRFL